MIHSKWFRQVAAAVLACSLALGQMPGIQGEAKAKVSVKKLTLNKSQYVLAKGKKVKLKASVLP